MTDSQAVWLYGSEARGDALPSSDVDVLRVGDGILQEGLLRQWEGRKLSVSSYGWEEIRRMASYGSLFLHHLKLEARVIFESPAVTGQLQEVLNCLPPYQRVQRDLRAFRQSLLDISDELPRPSNLEFELATLASLIRRIGILGSYLIGQPQFDRIGPVRTVVKTWKLQNLLGLEFEEFYLHRAATESVRCNPATPSAEVLAIWIERAKLMMDCLEAEANESPRFVRR